MNVESLTNTSNDLILCFETSRVLLLARLRSLSCLKTMHGITFDLDDGPKHVRQGYVASQTDLPKHQFPFKQQEEALFNQG